MNNILFRTLYFLIHFLYSLVDSVNKFWLYLNQIFYVEKPIQYDEIVLKSRVQNLNKSPPSHIVIIIGNEKPSYHDIARLIIWCFTSGISFISLYDYEGTLKKNDDKIKHALLCRKKEILDKLVWNKNHQNGISEWKNGNSQNKCHLNIFSFVDSQQSMVNVTKQLIDKNIDPDLVDVELIDKYLHNKFKFPEPELALIFGSLYCTYGFLPWFIRNTELLRFDTHHSLRVETFFQLLVRYTQCQQRHGK